MLFSRSDETMFLLRSQNVDQFQQDCAGKKTKHSLILLPNIESFYSNLETQKIILVEKDFALVKSQFFNPVLPNCLFKKYWFYNVTNIDNYNV